MAKRRTEVLDGMKQELRSTLALYGERTAAIRADPRYSAEYTSQLTEAERLRWLEVYRTESVRYWREGLGLLNGIRAELKRLHDESEAQIDNARYVRLLDETRLQLERAPRFGEGPAGVAARLYDQARLVDDKTLQRAIRVASWPRIDGLTDATAARLRDRFLADERAEQAQAEAIASETGGVRLGLLLLGEQIRLGMKHLDPAGSTPGFGGRDPLGELWGDVTPTQVLNDFQSDDGAGSGGGVYMPTAEPAPAAAGEGGAA